MRYKIFDTTPENGQWRWEQKRALKAEANYNKYLSEFSSEMSLDEYYLQHFTATREKLDFVRKNKDGVVQYYVPPRSYKLLSDNWLDISLSSNVTEFETEKSLEMVGRAIGWICKDVPRAIILDSFAGSGTTGHAVLKLNRELGGNRRFILVECEDYADSLTAERIRNAITGKLTLKNGNQKGGLSGSFSFFELGRPVELESILNGDNLPSYMDLARYVFYTATGEEFDEEAVDEAKNFIGESRNYHVFLFYEPNTTKLKNLALTLEMTRKLPPLKEGKRRLVFAPTKYLDQDHLDLYKIDFAQLPFEIYELAR
jgi:adenine-specific DNA-methyltransferase